MSSETQADCETLISPGAAELTSRSHPGIEPIALDTRFEMLVYNLTDRAIADQLRQIRTSTKSELCDVSHRPTMELEANVRLSPSWCVKSRNAAEIILMDNQEQSDVPFA
jgi:hypothetical protein